MPNYRIPPVKFETTDDFQAWLKEKGYVWPESPIKQESMMAEYSREGLSQRRGG